LYVEEDGGERRERGAPRGGKGEGGRSRIKGKLNREGRRGEELTTNSAGRPLLGKK
jgi:hypothetical protein